jgi:hypothetical protein
VVEVAFPVQTYAVRRLVLAVTCCSIALCGALAGSASAVAPGELSSRALTPWPALQLPDGRFPDYLRGGAAGRAGGYDEAMMGYALLQAGLREGNRPWIDDGLRAVSFAVAPSDWARAHPSVFEQAAVASAYRLARKRLGDDPAFAGVRGEWESWLRDMPPVRLPRETGYWNKYIVEAVAQLELLQSGLRSSVKGSALAERRIVAARLRRLVNERLPAVARRYRTVVRGRTAVLLSDPPANPLAYHGLTLGFLARAIDLMGPDAGPAARALLREMAEGSYALAAPDGAIAYSGRSEEQAWAATLTAYGLESAARVAAAPAARRYRALADRTLRRLARLQLGGLYGLYIVPALAEDTALGARGLDTYAGSVVYTSLASVALEWEASIAPGGPAAGRLLADRPAAAVLGSGPSTLATVRRGGVWMAVRRCAGSADLRYDFGLIGLKVRVRDGWDDVVPPRPLTKGRADSAGPVLIAGAGRGLPCGDSLSVAPGGTVTVAGGFRTAGGRVLRRGVTFRFVPLAKGARVEWSARRGDRFEVSAFLRRSDGPGPVAGGVVGANLRTHTRAPVSVTFADGYASGLHANLVRARMVLRAPVSGALNVAFEAR